MQRVPAADVRQNRLEAPPKPPKPTPAAAKSALKPSSELAEAAGQVKDMLSIFVFWGIISAFVMLAVHSLAMGGDSSDKPVLPETLKELAVAATAVLAGYAHPIILVAYLANQLPKARAERYVPSEHVVDRFKDAPLVQKFTDKTAISGTQASFRILERDLQAIETNLNEGLTLVESGKHRVAAESIEIYRDALNYITDSSNLDKMNEWRDNVGEYIELLQGLDPALFSEESVEGLKGDLSKWLAVELEGGTFTQFKTRLLGSVGLPYTGNSETDNEGLGLFSRAKALNRHRLHLLNSIQGSGADAIAHLVQDARKLFGRIDDAIEKTVPRLRSMWSRFATLEAVNEGRVRFSNVTRSDL